VPADLQKKIKVAERASGGKSGYSEARVFRNLVKIREGTAQERGSGVKDAGRQRESIMNEAAEGQGRPPLKDGFFESARGSPSKKEKRLTKKKMDLLRRRRRAKRGVNKPVTRIGIWGLEKNGMRESDP